MGTQFRQQRAGHASALYWLWLVVTVLARSPATCHAQPVAATPRPIQVGLLTGENNHDWKATTPILKEILETSGRFSVTLLDRPWEAIRKEKLAPLDVLLLNFNPTSKREWSAEERHTFLHRVGREGLGVAVVHAANNAFPAWSAYDEVLGGAWRQDSGHGHFHAFEVEVVDREHPITQGFPRSFLHGPDELYHRLAMQPGVRVLAQAYSSKAKGGTGQYEPMAWVHNYGRGRVFHTPMGHAVDSMRSSGFRSLLLRGCEWAATGRVTLPASFPEWRPLFDGKSLAGWRGDPKLWKVVDGVLVGDSPGIRRNNFLRTERRYRDFSFRCQVRLQPDGGNSGIQFRSEPLPDGEMFGYQADIGKGWWGSLYDESTGRGILVNSYQQRGAKAVRPEGWNDYEITVVGPRVTLKINGTVTSEFEDTLLRPEGHIAVQIHSGDALKVEFRNLLIKEY